MIHGLDHIAVAARSPDAAAEDYRLLLGQAPERRPVGNASRGATFQLANLRLELEPEGARPGAGEGLAALAFAVRDLDKAERLLGQRGLPSERDGASRTLRIAPAATHQVPIDVVQREANAAVPLSPPAAADEAAAVTGLDHVVIRSPNPERAVALYGARFGLDLRLDRSAPEWGMRLIFFRCGDLIVEVAHDLAAGIGDGPDRLWGLSWRVPDIANAQTRLRAAGVGVSDVRPGRRPATQVFTVKTHTAGVPTLVIGPKRDP
jgi:catechol 2,3-dioxygenase-like lactoylglutathione lyase family enzyme